MSNVPVGPNRVNPSGHTTEDAPKEPWRDNLAASSRSAGNSFKSEHKNQTQKGGLKKKLIAVAIAIVLLLGAFLFWSSQQSNPAAHIDKSKYQAVFFTNGQVYFGKLHKLDGDYYKLTDIFYIQANQTPANDDSKNPQATDDAGALTETQLVKLGDEIHGPDDAMIINRDQVLFFENLKKDGKVTDAIIKYRASKQ